MREICRLALSSIVELAPGVPPPGERRDSQAIAKAIACIREVSILALARHPNSQRRPGRERSRGLHRHAEAALISISLSRIGWPVTASSPTQAMVSNRKNFPNPSVLISAVGLPPVFPPSPPKRQAPLPACPQTSFSQPGTRLRDIDNPAPNPPKILSHVPCNHPPLVSPAPSNASLRIIVVSFPSQPPLFPVHTCNPAGAAIASIPILDNGASSSINDIPMPLSSISRSTITCPFFPCCCPGAI